MPPETATETITLTANMIAGEDSVDEVASDEESVIAESVRGEMSSEAESCDAPVLRVSENSGSMSGCSFETGVLKNVTLIKAGESKNRRFYPGNVLRRDVRIFEGLPAFYDHQDPNQPKPLKALIGSWENARFDGTGSVVADLRYPKTAEAMIEDIKQKQKLLGPDRVGPSIDMQVKARVAQVGGRVVQNVEALVGGIDASTDVVWNPAAGGSFASVSETMQGNKELEMLEGMSLDEIRAARPDLFPAVAAQEAVTPPPAAPQGEGATMQSREAVAALVSEQVTAQVAKIGNQMRFEAKVREARLPDAMKAKMLREGEAAEYETKACEGIFSEWLNLASTAPQVNVPGGITSVRESDDLMSKRMLRTFLDRPLDDDPRDTTKPFHSLREMVLAWHPEKMGTLVNSPRQFARESVGLLAWGGSELQDFLSGRARESVTTSTFTSCFADVMQKVLGMEVADPDLNSWRQLCKIDSFNDLTYTHKVIRIGDYANISAVNEGAPYQVKTSPGEEKVEYKPSKYGDLETYTWESALADDLGALTRIPTALGRAWAWTIYDGVYSMFQQNTGTGPMLDYDSTVLYHANHSNIATAAFTVADLVTAEDKFRQQTDISNSKKKKYRAKFLLYADAAALRQSIWEALVSTFKVNTLSTSGSQVNLPNYIQQYMGLTPVEVIYPTTTTTRWELIADPRDCDTFRVGFLHGRAEPELFVQDMERVGDTFNADVITFKIRGTFGADVINHRGFCRGNL